MHTALIDYFKKGLVASDKSDNRDFAAINKKAVKLGWIISPECCNKFVDEWLGSLTANYNATFYKEWNDVISRSRFEIFLDQIRHYASTYGKLEKGEEIEGNGFVPNDGGVVPRFEDLKVLEPIAADELAMKCLEVIKSGIALKDSTMKVMCDFYIATIPWKDDATTKEVLPKLLSDVKNKEAMCYLSQKFGVLPADEFGMLRCIASAYTGRMELIKSKATIAVIKAKAAEAVFRSPLLDLTSEQEKRLSRIFLRFKPIFLAMKGSKDGKVGSVVNRLRRLAEKNHKPFKIGFWESIIKTEQPMDEVKKRLEDLDNFRKIRLMMLCKERMNFPTTSGVFTIRNGKQFIRENYTPKYNKNWVSRLYFAIEESLCNSIRGKACVVRLPENYSIALPTSEKNFVGNFPYGTSFEMTQNNVLGVYWRNEWKTNDYDLSYSDLGGKRIGWNSSWYNGINRGSNSSSVVYSGDMTNANPEAVELMYIRNDAPDGILMLNKFYGETKSKFRFFFANESLPAANLKGHMVNPNNIKFDTMIDFDGQGQKTIGLMLDNRFYLMDMQTGKGRVSTGKYAPIIVEAMKKKAKSFIDLKEILLRAGFTLWEPAKEGEDEVKPDIDFCNLEKDTIINLLSK
jgi:hypothetical protein